MLKGALLELSPFLQRLCNPETTQTFRAQPQTPFEWCREVFVLCFGFLSPNWDPALAAGSCSPFLLSAPGAVQEQRLWAPSPATSGWRWRC